jgi:glucans biosynthesis protein
MAGAAALAAAPRIAVSAPRGEGESERAPQAPADAPFDFDAVRRLARARAEQPWRERLQTPVGPFADLDYDAYRAIRFDPARRLWRDEGLGFTVDLLPPGSIFTDAVAINVVRDGQPEAVPFDVSTLQFDPIRFGETPPTVPADAGLSWSGFRLRHPLNAPEVEDEVAVFQGASYFRAVARGQIYGVSARALAIGVASREGEEFPRFTDFWLIAPEPNATAITVYALLDSPSLAGAYAFVTRPGAETTMDVQAALFPRRDLADYGVAPLTSMYYFGEGDLDRRRDFRHAVHDSQGLGMISGTGERIWRPLGNPPVLRVSTFVDRSPRRFSLIQRSRAFSDYQDVEARYDLRPSVSVEPRGDWGGGGVRLIEIPTETEFNDNIVAFWRPETALTARSETAFDYRVVWTGDAATAAPLAQARATRVGVAVNRDDRLTVAVDFRLGATPLSALRAQADASAGRIEEVVLKPLPIDGWCRCAMLVAPPEQGDADLRLQLLDGSGAPASETWLYRLAVS